MRALPRPATSPCPPVGPFPCSWAPRDVPRGHGHSSAEREVPPSRPGCHPPRRFRGRTKLQIVVMLLLAFVMAGPKRSASADME
jgi:hypothetical protein